MTDEERGLLDYIADNFDTDRIERDGVFVRTRVTSGGQLGTISGSPHTRGYLRISIQSKTYYSHRLVYLWVFKKLPSKKIDHINHDYSDNRPSNLRSIGVNGAQKNNRMSKNNTSGYSGVSIHSVRKRDGVTMWAGQVSRPGHAKGRHVGKVFDNKQDAIDFVVAKRVEFGYHENHGKPKTTEKTQCEV